jgi:hypothetical protein
MNFQQSFKDIFFRSVSTKSNAELEFTTQRVNKYGFVQNKDDSLINYLQNSNVEEFSENIPIKVIRGREQKWIEMLDNYEEWIYKRYEKVKSRCRKGIPQSIRSKAWMYLTGANFAKSMKPNYYSECLANKSNIDIQKNIKDIQKDLHRLFPSHELFMKEEGRNMLFNVLKAYAVHNREVGYCQAQGPIAALLLMHMPEEDAFWMLIKISDFYLSNYFNSGLENFQNDGQILFELFKKENKQAYEMLFNHGIQPPFVMTEWFMCIYARTLPLCTVLRIWDMFFCEGIKVIFKVALYFMKSIFSTKQKIALCRSQQMHETLDCFKTLPLKCRFEKTLVAGLTEIKIDSENLRKLQKNSKEFKNDKTNMKNSKCQKE